MALAWEAQVEGEEAQVQEEVEEAQVQEVQEGAQVQETAVNPWGHAAQDYYSQPQYMKMTAQARL